MGVGVSSSSRQSPIVSQRVLVLQLPHPALDKLGVVEQRIDRSYFRRGALLMKTSSTSSWTAPVEVPSIHPATTRPSIRNAAHSHGPYAPVHALILMPTPIFHRHKSQLIMIALLPTDR